MPTARILSDYDQWCLNSRAQALIRYAPAGWEVTMQTWKRSHCGLQGGPFDLVFCLPPGQVEATRRMLNSLKPVWPDVKLIAAHNTELPRLQELFDRNRTLADGIVINNRAGFGRVPEPIRQADNVVFLPNGYDDSIFRVTVPVEKRSTRVLWTGGILGSNCGRDGVKGYSEFLVPLADELSRRNIPHSFVPVDPHGPHLRSPQQMADWYNSGTVFVCASEYEGAANSVVEAAACGCQIVTTACGEAAHIPDAYLVERTSGGLLGGVLQAIENQPLAGPVDMSDWTWELRAPAFFEFFTEVLK